MSFVYNNKILKYKTWVQLSQTRRKEEVGTAKQIQDIDVENKDIDLTLIFE